MRRFLSLACSLLLPSVGFAQIAPIAYADGTTVFVGPSYAAPVPSNWDVWSGFVRSAGGGLDAASLGVGGVVDTTKLEAVWQLSARATSVSDVVSSAELRYEILSVQQSGNLVIEWSENRTGAAGATLSVDLGDDGVIEATGSAVIPITLGQSTLQMRVRAEAAAQSGTISGPWGTSWSWSGDVQAELSIRFEPTHANSSVHAISNCAPKPTIEAMPNVLLGVDVAGGLSAGADGAIAVLGLSPIVAPLPWSLGCELFVDPVATFWLPVDAAGNVRLSLPTPPAARPISLFSQLISVQLSSLSLGASDARRIDVF